ncbi:MAG: hypothetical protein J7K73_02475 [Nanoarchaeota archaeon]|nr:hypothetical protein [Nanoarchaeota archaeon]
MAKRVEVKYNNMGYFRRGEIAEIYKIFEQGLNEIEARKASGFWILVEGTPKEGGLPLILEELQKRYKDEKKTGKVSIKFLEGYTPREIADALINLGDYDIEVEVGKYFG